jgi:hypothetical protein
MMTQPQPYTPVEKAERMRGALQAEAYTLGTIGNLKAQKAIKSFLSQASEASLVRFYEILEKAMTQLPALVAEPQDSHMIAIVVHRVDTDNMHRAEYTNSVVWRYCPTWETMWQEIFQLFRSPHVYQLYIGLATVYRKENYKL